MAISSLRTVVTGQFIQGLSSGSGAGAAAPAGLGGKKTQAIDVTLRSTAKNFAAGVQALNVGISYVNVSRDFNRRLLSTVGKLEDLVSRAGKGNLTGATAKVMREEFEALAGNFRDTLKKSKIEGRDVLDPDNLVGVIAEAGLSPDKVSELQKAFSAMRSLTKSSTSADGESVSLPPTIPVDQFALALKRSVRDQNTDEAGAAAEEPEDISANFTAVRDSLKKIRATLRDNLTALEETTDVLRQNLEITRAAGFAFLDTSRLIKGTESPEEIAERIRKQIQTAAPSALSQAQNLEPIMVAGLTAAEKQSENSKK
jgi:hypothetical protein